MSTAKCYVLFESYHHSPYLQGVFVSLGRAKASIQNCHWDGLNGEVKGSGADGDTHYFIEETNLDTDEMPGDGG